MTSRNHSCQCSGDRLTRRGSLRIGAIGALGMGWKSASQLWAAPSGDNVPGEDRARAQPTADGKTTIWDCHCHLGNIPGEKPADRMARVIEYADRLGIERLIVFMGWPFAYDPAPDEFRRQNDQVLAAIGDWPDRVFGYVYINPNHVDPSLKEIERCVVDGPMIGVKLWVATKCNDPALDPIIRLTTELQIPVYQHTWLKITGNLPGESTPSDLAELAARHPRATLVCGHAGGDWELGIRAIRPFPNVYLETAGGDPTSGIVDMAVRELGAERVVYGSDAGGRSFASQLAKVAAAEISSREKEMILGANLRRLLTPILEAKGIAF